jgi:hypothetical protein
MSNDEVTVRGEEADPGEELVAHVEAQFAAALEAKTSQLELTQAPFPNAWEVFAWGPWQYPFDPYFNPGRIIFTGEVAYIAVAVWMNPYMCPDIVNHHDKIELSFWTSNTQTMQPVNVPGLSGTICIPTHHNKCWYVRYMRFRPTEEACLYETNICARICNCKGHTLPRYAGFVRHVYDYDPEKLWPAYPVGPPGPAAPPSPTPGWGFDRPIRFMVADPHRRCCPED